MSQQVRLKNNHAKWPPKMAANVVTASLVVFFFNEGFRVLGFGAWTGIIWSLGLIVKVHSVKIYGFTCFFIIFSSFKFWNPSDTREGFPHTFRSNGVIEISIGIVLKFFRELFWVFWIIFSRVWTGFGVADGFSWFSEVVLFLLLIYISCFEIFLVGARPQVSKGWKARRQKKNIRTPGNPSSYRILADLACPYQHEPTYGLIGMMCFFECYQKDMPSSDWVMISSEDVMREFFWFVEINFGQKKKV